MDVDDAAGAGGLTPEGAATMKCFDLKNAGDDAWALVAAARGKPCKRCANALKQQNKSCGFCEHTPPAAGKRGTRDRKKPGATVEFETVPACNLVMDPETGLRPDGQTCRACWDACYKKDGYHGEHAVIGLDATPYPKCRRLGSGSAYSAVVASAHLKLKSLETSRAAGNR